MKTLLFSALLIFTLSGFSQTEYCVVGTGRLALAGQQDYIHTATYRDSTVDLTQRIHKEIINLPDVIFYFTAQGWELATINQMTFTPTNDIKFQQGGEYFILIFRRED